MNRLITTMMATCAALSLSAAAWHARVSSSAQDPVQLRQTIGTLAPAEQTAFLAEVNEAIAKMPGSDEVKAAKFLDANRAAVLGATKENRTAVLAEVFATVPPEFLTVINEEFAKNPFSRTADPARPISNEKFQAIATNVLAQVTARCANVSDGAVRAAFAALMFEHAAGGQEGIRDALVAQLPALSREVAKTEWMPAAMGEGREKSYDPMLGAAGAGEEPNRETAVALSAAPVVYAPQTTAALLAELQDLDRRFDSGVREYDPHGIAGAPISMQDRFENGLNSVPRAALANTKGGRGKPSGSGSGPEPGDYP